MCHAWCSELGRCPPRRSRALQALALRIRGPAIKYYKNEVRTVAAGASTPTDEGPDRMSPRYSSGSFWCGQGIVPTAGLCGAPVPLLRRGVRPPAVGMRTATVSPTPPYLASVKEVGPRRSTRIRAEMTGPEWVMP